MKLTIVSKREYMIQDKTTGEPINGYIYIAYTPTNKPIQFSSKKDNHPLAIGEIEFSPEFSSDVKLNTKIYDGKVKYSEIAE